MSVDVGKQIMAILQEYKDQTEVSLNAALLSTAKDAVNQLQANSPKNTGKYAGSWKEKKQKRQKGSGYVVYNEQYQLTHLLEKGHATRGGGRARAIPHIEPVANQVEDMIVEKLRRNL